MFRKENVDRRLLMTSILLLFIEGIVLLSDLGLIRLPNNNSPTLTPTSPSVGKIAVARMNVRRRAYESAVWEESQTQDSIYANDSILTLSDSAAKLNLEGDIHIDLHENTLVVIEAPTVANSDPFHLRFNRGDFRSRVGARKLSLASGEWSIEAQPGSDLSLRSIGGENTEVELEVQKGDVLIRRAHEATAQAVHSGDRVAIRQDSLQTQKAIEPEIDWLTKKDQRVYSHKFPVEWSLRWTGAPSAIRMLSPAKRQAVFYPKPGDTELKLMLDSGSYYFSLLKDDRISKTLGVQLLPAPRLTYLLPLPRDRVELNQTVEFSWIGEPTATSYRLELGRAAQFTTAISSSNSQNPQVQAKVGSSGEQLWRVIAIDEDGFEIPAAWEYPIESIADPLAAPKLRAPSSSDEPPDTSWLERVWSEIFPVAQAEATSPARSPVILNWEPVPGADHYTIEISSQPDFKSPEVIAQTSTYFYGWTDFEKRVYYYRVAGGTRDGRKGLFSRPEKLDLTNWTEPTKAAKVARTALQPQPAPIPPAPVPRRQSPPLAHADPAPGLAPPEPPAAEPTLTVPVASEVLWTVSYGQVRQSNQENLRAKFSGATPYQIHGRLQWPTAQGGAILSTIDLSSTQWRVSDPKKFAFQNQLTANAARAYFFAIHPGSNWSLGGGLGIFPWATRSGSEQMRLKSSGFGAIAAAYRTHHSDWRSLTRLAIEGGEHAFGFSAHFQSVRTIPNCCLAGPTVSTSWASGNGRSSLEWNVGFSLGLGW